MNRGDKVKLGTVVLWISLLFKDVKDYRKLEYEVKRVEGSICVLELKGQEFRVHEKLLKKIS